MAAHLVSTSAREPRPAVDHRQQHAGDREPRVEPRRTSSTDRGAARAPRARSTRPAPARARGRRRRARSPSAARATAGSRGRRTSSRRRAGQRLGEKALAVVAPRELDRRAGELGLRGHEMEVPEARRLRELRERRAVEQVVARRPVRALAEPRGCVRLRVEVDDERPLAGLGEAGGEIDRRRRLADAALLVRKRVDPPGHTNIFLRAADGSSSARRSGRFRATPGAAREARRASARASATHERGRRMRPRARRRRAAPRPRADARRRSAARPDEQDRRAARPRRAAGTTRAATGGGASAFATATPYAVRLLLLGAAADDPGVREVAASDSRKSHFRRVASSSDDLAVGQRGRERDPGRAAARADVDDRALVARDERRRRARLSSSVDAPRFGRIADRGQPRRLEQTARASARAASAGRDDDVPVGSSPSLCVLTPGSSWSAQVDDLRSIELIGSSSTGSPVDARLLALRIARAPRASRGGARDTRRHRRPRACAVPCRGGRSLRRGTGSRRSSGRGGRSAARGRRRVIAPSTASSSSVRRRGSRRRAPRRSARAGSRTVGGEPLSSPAGAAGGGSGDRGGVDASRAPGPARSRHRAARARPRRAPRSCTGRLVEPRRAAARARAARATSPRRPSRRSPRPIERSARVIARPRRFFLRFTGAGGAGAAAAAASAACAGSAPSPTGGRLLRRRARRALRRRRRLRARAGA